MEDLTDEQMLDYAARIYSNGNQGTMESVLITACKTMSWRVAWYFAKRCNNLNMEDGICLKYLVGHNAPLNLIKRIVNYGAIIYPECIYNACVNGFEDTAMYLYDKFCQFNNRDLNIIVGYRAMSESIYSLKLIQYFVNIGFNVNKNPLLMYACHITQFDVIKYLISKGAEVCYLNNICLNIMCNKGRFDIVKYLVSMGGNPNAHCNIAFAAQNGHCNIIAYLISHGAIPNKYDFSVAVINDNIEVVKLLVANKCKIPKNILLNSRSFNMTQYLNSIKK